MESLISRFPNVHVILCGGFNARIGSGNIEARDGLNVQITLPAHLLDCSSKDLAVNRFGRKLLELLLVTYLHVLHSTAFDLSDGVFAYVATCRTTTASYRAILPALLYMLAGRFAEMGQMNTGRLCLPSLSLLGITHVSGFGRGIAGAFHAEGSKDDVYISETEV